MSICTKTLESMKRTSKPAFSELKELNEDIDCNTNLLTRYNDMAVLAKSRCYNEGEKSNKYFLNLHKHQATNNEMSELEIEGHRVTDPIGIRNHVTSFY
jgi:hypothetical protein